MLSSGEAIVYGEMQKSEFLFLLNAHRTRVMKEKCETLIMDEIP